MASLHSRILHFYIMRSSAHYNMDLRYKQVTATIGAEAFEPLAPLTL